MHASLIKSLGCFVLSQLYFENSCALHTCLNNLHSYLPNYNGLHSPTSKHVILGFPSRILYCLAAYCPSILYHQETWTHQCLVMSAVFPQGQVVLSSSGAYVGVYPIVRLYFLLCSLLFKAVSFCKAACTRGKAYQSGERAS